MMSLPFEGVNGETKGHGGIFLSGEVGTQKKQRINKNKKSDSCVWVVRQEESEMNH